MAFPPGENPLDKYPLLRAEWGEEYDEPEAFGPDPRYWTPVGFYGEGLGKLINQQP